MLRPVVVIAEMVVHYCMHSAACNLPPPINAGWGIPFGSPSATLQEKKLLSHGSDGWKLLIQHTVRQTFGLIFAYAATGRFLCFEMAYLGSQARLERIAHAVRRIAIASPETMVSNDLSARNVLITTERLARRIAIRTSIGQLIASLIGDSDEAERKIRDESERHSGMIPSTIGA